MESFRKFFFFCRTTCPNSLDQCPVIPELLSNGCLSQPSLPPSNQELIILHISRCILSVCILYNISHNASLLVFHYHFYFLFIHEFLFRFFIVVGTDKSTTTTFLIFYYVIQFWAENSYYLHNLAKHTSYQFEPSPKLKFSGQVDMTERTY